MGISFELPRNLIYTLAGRMGCPIIVGMLTYIRDSFIYCVCSDLDPIAYYHLLSSYTGEIPELLADMFGHYIEYYWQ